MSPDDWMQGVGMEATVLLICSTAARITVRRSVRAVLSDSSSAAMVDGSGTDGVVEAVLLPVIVVVAVVKDGVSLDVSES